MKLTLDHTQRLNQHALLGAQRGDVATVRALWGIQDKLALDADEEQALDLMRETVNGQERTVWNSSLSLPATHETQCLFLAGQARPVSTRRSPA